MACASNIDGFVKGELAFYDLGNVRFFDVLELAQWVSYQSFRSPYYGAVPVSLILGQWGFELGWSTGEFSSRWNPGNQDGMCGYRGSYLPGDLPPGKRLAFVSPFQGVTAYAHLLIAGYPHVLWAYSAGGYGKPGLERAVNALSRGYDTGYSQQATTYCATKSYALNSDAQKRIWATAGYSGLYSTLTWSNNTCLVDKLYVQTSNPRIGFSDIDFSEATLGEIQAEHAGA